MRGPVVIGVGNTFRGDDGVGPAVAARLTGHVPGCDVELLDGEPTRLIDAWRDRSLAVVVDAVASGAEAGTVVRFEQGMDRLARVGRLRSSHGAGVAEAIALGRALDRLPDRLVVYGVELGSVADGPGLTPAVAAALDGLVDRIRGEVTNRCA